MIAVSEQDQPLPYSAWMVSPVGRPVIVAVIGELALPLVGPPPVLITVIWYWSPASPWRNAPSMALSAVRSGTPTIGVALAIDAVGPVGDPPVTVTALVTCSPLVESWVPNPADSGTCTVSVIGGYDCPGGSTAGPPPAPPVSVQVSVGSLEVSQVQPVPPIEDMLMFGSTTSVSVTGVEPSVAVLPVFVTVIV